MFNRFSSRNSQRPINLLMLLIEVAQLFWQSKDLLNVLAVERIISVGNYILCKKIIPVLSFILATFIDRPRFHRAPNVIWYIMNMKGNTWEDRLWILPIPCSLSFASLPSKDLKILQCRQSGICFWRYYMILYYMMLYNGCIL